MRKTLTTVLVALSIAVPSLVVGQPAAAAGTTRVEQGSFVEEDEFDDTEYCAGEGVPSFHVVMSAVTDYAVLYDDEGAWVRLTAHHVQKYTLSANGKTLSEEDHWTNVFYPDGTATTTGSHTHIRGDEGIVLRDAGRLVEAADGSVDFMAGKWPQFSGTTFCQELLP